MLSYTDRTEGGRPPFDPMLMFKTVLSDERAEFLVNGWLPFMRSRGTGVGGSSMSDDWSDEETDDPLRADDCNFYKVEKWTQDGMKVDSLLYAGNNLSKAQEIFVNAIKDWPRIRITIRQRTRVLKRWPQQRWRG
jgi:hypothetical protein